MVDIQHTTQIRVKYADTDAMGVVNNGRYYEYLEAARNELLRAYGIPYRELENHGVMLPLIESGMKYKSPAVYDDIVEIEARCEMVYSPRLTITYKLRVGDKLLGTGTTVHVFTDKKTFRPVRPPKMFVDSFTSERISERNK